MSKQASQANRAVRLARRFSFAVLSSRAGQSRTSSDLHNLLKLEKPAPETI
jgi:hypothetical protein